MNYSNIKNCNQRQFDATMKREGITVNDYYDSSKTYDVFFRRNKRGTAPQGKLRLYYAQQTPISIGTIFTLKDVPYLVISQDGIESDIYYSSIAVKCDTSFIVFSSTEKKLVTVPCVVISDKYTLAHNATITIVSGSVTVYTGDNPYARDMNINNKYYNFSAYYKVGNTFYNNGLAYVYMTREADPTSNTYYLKYKGETSLDMADSTTYQLSYTAIKNDVYVVPTLTYASSDDTIATVDDTGLMTLLASGNVTITATWNDGTNTKTCDTAITITNNRKLSPTLTITTNGNLTVGYNRTYTATYTDADGNDVSSNYTCVWTFSNLTFDESKIETYETDNKIKLKITDDYLVGKTFTLNVVDSGNTFTPASYDITIYG